MWQRLLEGLDAKEHLAELHLGGVLGQDGLDPAALGKSGAAVGDLVEALHDLDEAQHAAGADLGADLDVGRGVGRRPPVEDALRRPLDRDQAGPGRIVVGALAAGRTAVAGCAARQGPSLPKARGCSRRRPGRGARSGSARRGL